MDKTQRSVINGNDCLIICSFAIDRLQTQFDIQTGPLRRRVAEVYVALYPGFLGWRRKRAWIQLFARVQINEQYNMWSLKGVSVCST